MDGLIDTDEVDVNQSLPRFDQGRVLVVGDVMLDRYYQGDTQRISPEAPVPVVKIGQTEDRPGGAANCALNVAALGCPATLIGMTGRDEAADCLSRQLSSVGITLDFSYQPDLPTITKLRVVSRQQQLIRLDFEASFANLSASDLLARVENQLQSHELLLLSDYNKGTLAEVQKIISLARQRQRMILVDPKGEDFSRYRGATLLTPNLSEFEAVVGRCETEQQLLEKGAALIHQLDLQALLITRSEKGMTLLCADGQHRHFPAQAREVYDVTGAGDTVIAVLSAALSAWRNPEPPFITSHSLFAAVALANAAAGLVVGKLGTATVSMPELRRASLRHAGVGTGVLSEEQLAQAVEDARAQGERIVFTNGCFDILHAGHVSYLAQARGEGDRLIVAVNADASVRKLKGEGRPINSAQRRMQVLAALESVDWVLCFSEDTPEHLLALLKPDVLVKGGDYGVDQVVGAGIVQAYGGVVKVMGLVDECSTTAIVDKIRDQDEP